MTLSKVASASEAPIANEQSPSEKRRLCFKSMSASASLESASENRPCPRGPVRDALPAEPRRRAALGSRHSAGVRRRFWRRKEAGAGRRQARAQASGGDRHRRIETTLAMRESEHRKAGAGHNHAIFAGYASLWPSHATARSDSRRKSAGRVLSLCPSASHIR